VRPSLLSASATTALGEPCTVQRALSVRSRAAAALPRQTQASARQPLSPAATTCAAGCCRALPSETARTRLGSLRVVGCRQLPVN
jgi:hypothetical protein